MLKIGMIKYGILRKSAKKIPKFLHISEKWPAKIGL